MPSTFNLAEALEILERTPLVLASLLTDVSESWTRSNEGGDSWNAYDIVGHMVVGEQTDWLTRTRTILEFGTEKPFDPFDRFLQFQRPAHRTIEELLDVFRQLREENLDELRTLISPGSDFNQEGTHPAFGTVTLSQLLSAWVVHDLGHIAQLARVMAKRYSSDVGPWIEYLPILTDRNSTS